MTFVVAMFAATVALVWFGYVATREWRSGTNLLRRAARQRGAGARARDPQGRHERRLDYGDRPVQYHRPGRGSAVQHVPGRGAHLCAVPVSRVVRAVEPHGERRRGDLRVQPRGSPSAVGDTALVGRSVPGRADPRPARAGRTRCGRPEACDSGVAVHHAGAADRRDALPDRRARALRVRSIPRTPGIHGVHGQRAVAARGVLRSARGAGREDRRGQRRPLDYGVRRRGPRGDEGGAGRARGRRRSSHPVPAPLHRPGARQIDLVAPDASARVDGARAVATGSGAPRDASGRTADVHPDFDRGRRESAGARPDCPRRPGECRAWRR